MTSSRNKRLTVVASVMILHEHTQLNRFCCFQTLDAVFSKDLFPEQPSLCRVAGLKSLPVHRYSVVICTFSGSLGL